mgnify:CR=1 FL=1
MPEKHQMSSPSMDGMAIIDEISRAIIGADDIGSIAYLILDLAISYTDAEKGSLMLLDNRGQLYIHSARGINHDLSRDYRLKIGEGIAGRVAAEQQPVLVTDIETDQRFPNSGRDRYKTCSFVSCPIIDQHGLLGVLNINDKKNGLPFSPEEFSLIKAVASQAALALKNARLVDKFKEKISYSEEVNRKLIETDLAKTDFLTRLSHELRTPLNSIKGAVYYLKNVPSSQGNGHDEFLRIIESEADRLAVILEKQLDFLRLENERRVVQKSIISIVQLLQQALDSHLIKKTLSQCQVCVELEDNILEPDIVGDKVQVSHLLMNLIAGLAGHLEKGAGIQIRVQDKELVSLEFVCSQPVDEATVKTLFQGSDDFGLGESSPAIKLHLVRKAVETNGWQIEAHNAAEGLVCRLQIPRMALEMEEAALDMTMGRVLEFVSGLLGANTSSLMLCDQLSGDLVIRSARGLDEEVVRGTRLRIGDRLAGWVAAEGKPLLVEDIEGDPRFGRGPGNPRYSSRSLLSVPLKRDGQVIGVLNLTDKHTDQTFTDKDLKVAQVVVERISAFIDNLKGMASQGERDFRKIVASLDSLLSAEARYAKRNTCYLEVVDALMKELGASEREQELALYVALIYDLGLVLLDRRLLEKKHELSELEMTALQSHPFTTLELLQGFDCSEEVRHIILHHHEHFDGSGYPDGLAGEQIPLLSRILAVVDSYCAMTEERPYRGALPAKDAFEQLRQGAGRCYDPEVVEALKKVLPI